MWGSTRTLCLPNGGESYRWVLPVGHQHLNQLLLIFFIVRPWRSCHFTALVLVTVLPTGVNVPSEKSKRTSLPPHLLKLLPKLNPLLRPTSHERSPIGVTVSCCDCWRLLIFLFPVLVYCAFWVNSEWPVDLGMMAGTARCGMCLTSSIAVLLCRRMEESQQFCM